MPTESDLRDLLRGPDGSGSGLDAGEIIRRAHRRRTPKVVAAGVGGLLVVAAVVVPVASLSLAHTTPSAGAGSASSPRDLSTGRQADGMKQPASPEGSACAAPAPAPTDAALGASVEVADTASGAPLAGTLVLRGSDSAAEVSVTGPVTLTLLRDDAVVWSGTADLGTPRLSLAADGEARLPFSVRVVDCGSGGALTAGDYRIVASVPVSVDGGTAQRIGGDGEVRIS